MKVRALKTGYIFGKLAYEGEEFILTDEKQFSKLWMEVVEKQDPEKLVEKLDAKKETKTKKKARKIVKDVL
jgi:hypothetical protein